MKRRLWFLGSVFAMLLVLAMWLIAGERVFAKHSFQYNEPCLAFVYDEGVYVKYESYFGFGDIIGVKFFPNNPEYRNGKILFYNWTKPTPDVNCDNTIHSLRDFIPAQRWGWVLLCLAVIQYLFFLLPLVTKIKRRRKSKTIANPVIEDPDYKERDIKVFKHLKKKPIYRFVRYAMIMQLSIASAIFILDFCLVFCNKNLKYYIFFGGYKFDSLALNFEFILPPIIYLLATIISVLCLSRYTKLSKFNEWKFIIEK